jgi:hypothetical protein
MKLWTMNQTAASTEPLFAMQNIKNKPKLLIDDPGGAVGLDENIAKKNNSVQIYAA